MPATATKKSKAKQRRKTDAAKPKKEQSPKRTSAADAYELRKERERERQANQSREGRDIAHDMPPVVDPGIRKKCEKSLRFFAMECFPEKFGKLQ